MKQMICNNCGGTQPFDLDGHQGKYQCHNCGGEYCGCDHCQYHIEQLEKGNYAEAQKALQKHVPKLIGWDCQTGYIFEEK